MNYYRYNKENKFIGITETEPLDSLWTTIEPPLFIKPTYNGTTWIEGEVLTEEEKILQSRRNQALQIKEKYEFHRLNGWNAYQDFRAMIILDIHDGKITENQAFLIEKDLKVAYDRIAQNGDWKTAYYELSQKTVSYPFIQNYMTIALNFILNYIQTNYDS